MIMDLCIHELQPATCSVCNGTDTREKLKRGRPFQRERWAEEIFQHIPVNEEGWISSTDLAEASGLTVGQVAAAIAYLRDNMPALPLVSGPQGYTFTVDAVDVGRFRAAAARTAHTRIRRMWLGVVKPYVEQLGDQVTVRLLTRQFERLLEDIEELTA